VLGPKEGGAYTTDDLNVVAACAQMTALALASAEGHRTIEVLNDDLQAKVAKIAEQQRRIAVLQSQLLHQSRSQAPKPGPEVVPQVPVIAADIPPRHRYVGSSAQVGELLNLVAKVAASPSAVLLRGESGTGKDVLARSLHEASARAAKAFVKVHCAALSPGLLESELFGHVKGAFTGAHRDKVGRFELADGGTLFLDEIGDISLDVQTKLLRVIQEMAFERVGSSEPVQVDVRLITATHQDLEALIRQGRFRTDLFYRLNVVTITVPPLRERREDIPELAAFFLQRQAGRGGKSWQLDDDALSVLKGYDWPGNIRQLENVLERAVVVAEGPVIGVRELPAELFQAAPESAEDSLDRIPAFATLPERGLLERREREQLVRALAAAAGNKAEAARALGLARSTLFSKLRKHGLS
jgi:transcriptional regulator with GAF, ATPase, and Fis domain